MNTGVGSHSLLQGIFLTRGSDLGIKLGSPALQVNSLPSEPPGILLDGLKETASFPFPSAAGLWGLYTDLLVSEKGTIVVRKNGRILK